MHRVLNWGVGSFGSRWFRVIIPILFFPYVVKATKDASDYTR